MVRPFLHRTLAVAAWFTAALAAPAHAGQTVLWPSFATVPPGVLAPAMIDAPDLAWQTTDAAAAKFDRRVDYATLAATMGLSDEAFAGFQVLAWEGNGGSPGSSGGWESAAFVFDDLRSAVSARYDEVGNRSDNPAVRFLTGSITGAQYDALFGTRGAEPVMSWLLVGLPASVDVRSPSFSIGFRPGGISGGLGEGTPDLDAIGVIASVPEPGTLALVAAGLVVTGGFARRHMCMA